MILKIHSKLCNFCKKQFKARKTQKYCTGSCSAKNRMEHLTKIHEAKRKYPKIEGLNRLQIYRKFNPEKNLYYLHRDSMKRIVVIQYLGGKCIRCGYDIDIRALQLDHIKGDGKEDRKRLGSRICRYYVNNLEEAKQKLQVYCANCHAIKTYIMEEKTSINYRDYERNEGFEEFLSTK
jgi:hypothetical protein